MRGPLVLSFNVVATLAAQRIVAITAAETVGFPANNQALPIGVTFDTVLDTTSAIAVQVNGIAKVLVNDTISAGALVSSNSSGQGVPFTLADTTTALTLASAYLGPLVGATAVSGDIALVLISPGFDRE